MKILELRILPPLVFARFGSAEEPLDNYTLTPDPQPDLHGSAEADGDPLGYRKIRAAETLEVRNGKLVAKSPDPSKPIRFKDDCGRVRPVAPFLEVWALTDANELVPLDLALLKTLGLGPNNVRWQVHVENRKVYRRTGDAADIVSAQTDWRPGPGEAPLRGACPARFVPDGTVDFGKMQCIEPTTEFPEIRLRFTPGAGIIYAPTRPVPGTPDDEAYVTRVYKNDNPDADLTPSAATGGQGEWPGFQELDPLHDTLPPALFAIVPPAPPWLNNNRAVSRGYLDQACDGFVSVKLVGSDSKDLTAPDGTSPLAAKARIGVAPPVFVPDAVFMRTLADDLDQALDGPVAPDAPAAVLRAQAEELIRRGYEAVRCMNVAVMNGNPVKGRPALAFDTMPAEEAFDVQRPLRPVMAEPGIDTFAIMELHRQVFTSLRSGAAPWFVELLRKPEEAGDLTDNARRKMPALMSGADGFYLTLTRRQIDTVRKVAAQAMFSDLSVRPSAPTGTPAARRVLDPKNLSAQLHYAARGNPQSSRPIAAIGNCCPGLEFDFRAVWRNLFEGITLVEYDNYVADTSPDHADLKGHRLLRVDGRPVVAPIVAPASSDPNLSVPVMTEQNPDGVMVPEWSNNFAFVLRKHGEEVVCDFTADVAKQGRLWDDNAPHMSRKLKVRQFFEPGTAVISAELAKPGELTQGLCSPWQNDLRECSCYYWASSRPDYVNVELTPTGGSRGDNWMAKERTGNYIADDYVDERLVHYDDMFVAWEKWLKFQIRGRDEPEAGAAPNKRKGVE